MITTWKTRVMQKNDVDQRANKEILDNEVEYWSNLMRINAWREQFSGSHWGLR